MSGVPVFYCAACHALRAVQQWHEHSDSLLIELAPCGHVTLRNARVEWAVRRAA